MDPTSQFDEIERRVRECMTSVMLADDDHLEPASEDDLLRSGLIDSLGVMEIVSFLEENFNVDVDDQDIVPANFSSIRDVARFVATKKGIPVPEMAGFQQLVGNVLTANSTMLVVSRGDDRLVALGGHHCRHFPCTAGGEYAGHHPCDSDDAIARLEEQRTRGATHIAFPSDELWWLEHYKGLAAHLEATAHRSVRNDAGVVYALA